jgi:hypothetical protein
LCSILWYILWFIFWHFQAISSAFFCGCIFIFCAFFCGIFCPFIFFSPFSVLGYILVLFGFRPSGPGEPRGRPGSGAGQGRGASSAKVGRRDGRPGRAEAWADQGRAQEGPGRLAGWQAGADYGRDASHAQAGQRAGRPERAEAGADQGWGARGTRWGRVETRHRRGARGAASLITNSLAFGWLLKAIVSLQISVSRK